MSGVLGVLVAVLWGGLLLGLWLWAMIAVVVPGFEDGVGEAIRVAVPLHGCLLLAMFFAGAGLMLGALYLVDARQLDRLELAIDGSGIAGSGRHRFRVPWDQVRGVIVTNGGQGARLLVDAGKLPPGWWTRSRIPPGRAHLLLLRGRRGPVLNVPLHALAADPAEVIRVLRAYADVRVLEPAAVRASRAASYR